MPRSQQTSLHPKVAHCCIQLEPHQVSKKIVGYQRENTECQESQRLESFQRKQQVMPPILLRKWMLIDPKIGVASSYPLALSSHASRSLLKGITHRWHFVLLLESHKMKNLSKSLTSKHVVSQQSKQPLHC